MLLLLIAALASAGVVKAPVATVPALPTPAITAVLPKLSVPALGAPALTPALTPSLSLPQLQNASAPQPNVAPEVHFTNLFDGGGVFNGAPVVAEEQNDDLVSKAQKLFFPDGRAPVVAAGKAPKPEGVPGDGEMQAKMELSPLTNPEREAAVKQLFIQAGAKPEEIVTQDAGRGRNNIMVVKKGKTDRVIVVGAHHDKVSEGRGAIDNWTGTTMMINLYQAVRDLETDATYVFIGFAREEEGLIGSEKYVSSLSADQRKKIDSMVNLDTLAVDGTFSWKNNSTQVLLDLIKAVSKQSGYALTEAYLNGGDADSSTFRRAKIPAMTVFGASQDVIFDIIHSERDNISAFSLQHYKNAYLLTLELLKALDKNPVRR